MIRFGKSFPILCASLQFAHDTAGKQIAGYIRMIFADVQLRDAFSLIGQIRVADDTADAVPHRRRVSILCRKLHIHGSVHGKPFYDLRPYRLILVRLGSRHLCQYTCDTAHSCFRAIGFVQSHIHRIAVFTLCFSGRTCCLICLYSNILQCALAASGQNAHTLQLRKRMLLIGCQLQTRICQCHIGNLSVIFGKQSQVAGIMPGIMPCSINCIRRFVIQYGRSSQLQIGKQGFIPFSLQHCIL